ncbi:hypothetical protein [Taibaiella koreensis]|uniref:hypothetical protein n=1 Tax=Taibaiella koreensis TaxID=1268548 RepID=UPI000E59D023|nr:hypothetical protein [Taibaiella koreensis]
MTSISNAKHQAFHKGVKELLSKPGGLNTLTDRKIEERLQHMEQLYGEYVQHLRALQSLVIRYEAARKEARILLRKRLSALKQQAARDMKVMSKTISKAS